ncbi:MAG: STAS domain-containing protein [Bacilli bacterium]|nr:STAS domain-containing protein [Bacilli bacterium]
MFELKLEFNKGILFARCSGALVREEVIKINRDLLNFLINNEVKYLVYNLYNLNEIDSAGINALLNTKYVINKHQGMVIVCEAPNKLMKCFQKINFNMVNNEIDAINYMRNGYGI